jgi:hypothetical protein
MYSRYPLALRPEDRDSKSAGSQHKSRAHPLVLNAKMEIWKITIPGANELL